MPDRVTGADASRLPNGGTGIAIPSAVAGHGTMCEDADSNGGNAWSSAFRENPVDLATLPFDV